MSLVVASIDIGYCDFAQYIEEFSINEMERLEVEYSRLSYKLQRKMSGIMSPEIKEILRQCTLSGKRLQTGVYNFTTTTNQGLDNETRKALLTHLDKFKELWDKCDEFIIEQQFYNIQRGGKKGSGVNMDAIKMGEDCYIWFLYKYPNKSVSYIGSQYKTRIFGAPKMKKPERKKWVTQLAREMYIERGDEDMINIFDLKDDVRCKRIKTEKRIKEFIDKYPTNSSDASELAKNIIIEKQKLDDISDAAITLQAYKYKTRIAHF